MSQNTVILLLGTNLGSRNENIKTAESLIGRKIGEIINFSEIITTEPEGFISDNLFLNRTIKVSTSLSPVAVLNRSKEIEKEMGRHYLKTNQKFQDRIIDIDLLLFNNIKFESQSLTIPHPQIYSRIFIKKIMNCHLES